MDGRGLCSIVRAPPHTDAKGEGLPAQQEVVAEASAAKVHSAQPGAVGCGRQGRRAAEGKLREPWPFSAHEKGGCPRSVYDLHLGT